MILQWFRVTLRLNVEGASRDELPELQADLQEELAMREHLRNPVVKREVVWNANVCLLEIAFDIQGINLEQTTDMASEELLEISAGVVRQMTRIRVESVDTQPA